MFIRKLTDTGDIEFGKGSNSFYKDSPDAVATAIQMRFNLMFGEIIFNTLAGTDLYLDGMSKESIDTVVRERIIETKDVIDIGSFESEHDKEKRLYKAIISVYTTYGNSNVEITI